MPEIAADLKAACSGLLPGTGIEENQLLDPDPIPSRACAREGKATRGAARDAPRDTKGRFAKGHSGNPQGRPPGIRNPRRRPLGLLLRQARPGTLAPLIRRKRHLRLPVLRLMLPPPARRADPGELLGIDFSRLGSADQIAAAIGKVLAAMRGGEIGPGEAARLVRRLRKPLRALRGRQWRRLARLEASGRKPLFGDSRRTGSSPASGGGGAPHGPMGAPERAEAAILVQTPLHHAAHGPPPLPQA